jgi:hypothetical protein
VSLKKVMEWMAHAGGTSPKEIAMKARVRERREGPKNKEPYADSLHRARVTEHQAVVALDEHRKEHGC